MRWAFHVVYRMPKCSPSHLMAASKLLAIFVGVVTAGYGLWCFPQKVLGEPAVLRILKMVAGVLRSDFRGFFLSPSAALAKRNQADLMLLLRSNFPFFSFSTQSK